MKHISTTVAVALILGTLLIAPVSAQSPPTRANTPKCTITKLQSGTNSEAVKLCRSATAIPSLQENDSLSFYYGYVTATSVTNTIDATNKRSLGKFLAGIFSTEKFTAQVSVVLEIQTSTGSITLPEQPLLIIQRKSEAEVEISNMAGAYHQTRITPYFTLDEGDPNVVARFRVRRINSIDLRIDEVAKSAAEIAGPLGAEGWLITNLTTGPLLDAITKSQEYASTYFSDDVSVSVSAPLSFKNPTKVTFETGWTGATPSIFNIALELGVRQSLVSARLRVVDPKLSVPDVITAQYAPPGGTWANAIVIQPAAAGRPARRLDSVLATSGVPRRLKDLETPALGSNEPAADRVGSACDDLVSALSSDEYFRLNRTDAALILYDQLSKAGVFSRYRAGQVRCVENHVSLWQKRFGLPFNSFDDPVIEYAEMKPRLDSLGGGWKKANALERAAMSGNFVSPLQIELPIVLYPEFGGYLVEQEEGIGIGQLSASALAARALTCFGEYRRVPPVSATTFARFQSETEPFVFAMDFVRQPGLGVLIRRLTLRRMTPAEQTANAQANCVAPPS